MYRTIFPLVFSSNVRLVLCCVTAGVKEGLRSKICPQKKVVASTYMWSSSASGTALVMLLLISFCFGFSSWEQQPGSMFLWKSMDFMKINDAGKSHNTCHWQCREVSVVCVRRCSRLFGTWATHIHSSHVCPLTSSFGSRALPSCDNHQAPDLCPGWEE